MTRWRASDRMSMETKPKNLLFKDVESLKTFVVITAVAMSAFGSLLVFWGALFG